MKKRAQPEAASRAYRIAKATSEKGRYACSPMAVPPAITIDTRVLLQLVYQQSEDAWLAVERASVRQVISRLHRFVRVV